MERFDLENVKRKRIYVCHTYYHAYIAHLKELALPEDQKGGATILLSTMSTDFEKLGERIKAAGLFEKAVRYEEKNFAEYPELLKYKEDKGNIVFNMFNRIKFTKKYGKICEESIPEGIDFKDYDDIYVFCDSDPIGYYLNTHKFKYHALEDGLNCLRYFDTARYDNMGAFKLKVFMSKKLGLIFIQNGYGKYCIDCEVNSIEMIEHECPYYVEVPRQTLVDRLTDEDKKIILRTFIRDIDSLNAQIEELKSDNNKVLILTDPLCDLDTRKRIFQDLIDEYSKKGTVFLKPHPRDELNYRVEFADVPQFDPTVPMEMFNFFDNLRFKTVVSVFTEVKAIQFADEIVKLGPDFMDKYEDPAIHRQRERIK